MPIAPTERVLNTRHGAVCVADNERSAPAVLLIHGNSMCWQVFSGQFGSPLGARFRMIALDLPGHGSSPDAADPARSCTIPAYAETALEVLDALGVGTAAVLGWSLGGHIGLEIMARWDGLKGLMIVGTPPVAPQPEALAEAFVPGPLMAFAGQADAPPGAAEAYARACCGPAADRMPFLLETARRTDGRARGSMMAAALAGQGADGRRLAETAATPLAVVCGELDPFVNRSYLTALRYANLWRGRVFIQENCGHAPFLDDPGGFNELLGEFLSCVENK